MKKMSRLLSFIAVLTFLILVTAPSSYAGTSIKINYAKFDVNTQMVMLYGINFDAFGPLEVSMGATILTNACSINSDLIECSIIGTPAESGGTFTISVSAGNSPHQNEEIDVFIPMGLVIQECFPGTVIDCYPGDPSTNNIGICKPGTQTCLNNGSWGNCIDYVIPTDEVCGNGIDEDCDGSDLICPPIGCADNLDCDITQYCEKATCSGIGTCVVKPLSCPTVFDPVCGCDGQTYGNECDAAAAGVNVASSGACPTSSLQYFTTCGSPLCGPDLPPTGEPACTTSQIEGNACATEGEICDPQIGCGVLLICASEDPKLTDPLCLAP